MLDGFFRYAPAPRTARARLLASPDHSQARRTTSSGDGVFAERSGQLCRAPQPMQKVHEGSSASRHDAHGFID